MCFATVRCTAAEVHTTLIAIFALALAIVPWAHYFAGQSFYAGDAFISSFYLVGLAAAISVGFTFSQHRPTQNSGTWLIPAKVLLIASVASALLAILQWLAMTDSISTFVATTDLGDRAMANLGQPNQLGTLLLMGLGALVLMFELFKINSFVVIVGVLVLTWGVVLTESRTAILSASGMAIFLVFKIYTLRASSTPLRLRVHHVFLWSCVFVSALQALPFINAALLLDSERSVGLLDSNGRVSIWMQTIYAIAEAPLFGYGWNQTPVAQAIGALRYQGDLAFSNAHNLVLDLMAWVGVPLALVITAGLAYWLVTRAKAAKSTGAVYAMAMLTPVLVHSALEFPFAYAYFLLTAGLLIGIVESDYTTKAPFSISRGAGLTGLVVFTLIGAYSAYEYLLIEEDYRVARFENLKVGRTEVGYVAPPILVHTQMAALLAALRQPADRGMDKMQLERLRQVSLRFGMRPLVFRYAVALGLNDEPVASAKQMRVFRGMFGERAYQGFKAEFRRLQAEKYPELSSVDLP